MVFQNKDRFHSYLLLNLLELLKIQRQDPQHSHEFIYPKDCLNPNLDFYQLSNLVSTQKQNLSRSNLVLFLFFSYEITGIYLVL